ncbi:glycosyltransferase [Enterococcus faecium]|uniref:glycosyltransferase n=1 Tax=Enterococcus faecium TaxID=1352 RepID=UPI0021E92A2D|nr:glycosyltransferase [Enterococcus faecium]MCV3202902.1 glycosyltransferase [Enterococcus faecium]MCV6663209.1 glycosyltransferase [Enterococcus faecium]
MKIVVNDIAASEGGALSVLNELYAEILASEDKNEWFFFLGKDYIPETNNIKVKTFPKIKKSWTRRLLFDLFYGRIIINKIKPDIYISLQNTATIGVKAKQYVYLHQSLPYQTEHTFSIFKKQERKYAIYQKIIGRIYNFLFYVSKSTIIVQTKWFKNAVKRKISNNVVIVPPKVNFVSRTYESAINSNGEITFFYPAAKEIYKNHEVIFKAVDKVVNQGYKNFRIVLTIPIQEVNNKDMYTFLGTISREDVFEWYTKSVLLFPSFIETYGLPLKEAQLSNTPIIASNTDFAREVLRDYDGKYFFDKYNDEQLCSIMISVIQSEGKINKKSNINYRKEKLTLFTYLTKYRKIEVTKDTFYSQK